MTPQIEKEITDKVNELILALCPDAGFTSKYGGTLIEAVAGDPKSAIGGLFFYAQHASFELANGATFDDPNKFLEGKGKYRRHIKLTTAQDIESKQLPFYLEQAFR
jgi:hypothetical protein